MLWIAFAASRTNPSASPPEADLVGSELQSIAWWALQFSPRVCIENGVVLLEVGDSLRLFGGRKVLLERLRQEVADLGGKAMGVAPTATAAQVLLSHCLHAPPDPESTAVLVSACAERQLTAVLDALPLEHLAASHTHLPTLQRLGCNTLGQLRALPRGGLARRFGAGLLEALDQAYGLRPESHAWLVLPERFEQRIELMGRIDVAEGLLFAAKRLLGQLLLWLRARQQGLTAWMLFWEYDLVRSGESTRGELTLRTAQASRDASHLTRLMAEHLAKTTLAAPAIAVGLTALETESLTLASDSLLPDTSRKGESLQQLIERLSARLGADKILVGHPLPDHRPQHMQQWVPANDRAAKPSRAVSANATPALPRSMALYPPWILAEPLRLAVRNDRPIYQGALMLLAGPLRIETGWWSLLDQADTEGTALTLRDYHVALSPHAGLLWIYRRRSQGEPAWFLHGIYG